MGPIFRTPLPRGGSRERSPRRAHRGWGAGGSGVPQHMCLKMIATRRRSF